MKRDNDKRMLQIKIYHERTTKQTEAPKSLRLFRGCRRRLTSEV